MSSVTEAPRWPHTGSAVRREPRFALRGSARLELVRADTGILQFAGRQTVLPPLFLSPLLLVLGSLPWLAPRPLDVLRATTSLVCVGAAFGVAAWAWPRRRRLHVSARSDASNAGALVAQPGKVRWVLAAEQAPNAISADYTVLLELGDIGSHTVLQNPDPERLLWQFSEVLRHWPGPVECRWGLPETAKPWSIEPHSGPRALGESTEQSAIASPLAHRPLVWCARVMAALVITDLIFLVTTTGAGIDRIHPLSLVLPLLLAGCLGALAVGLATGREQLLVSGGVRRESSIFGIRRSSASVRRDGVRGVYALGGACAERWHVLVDSTDGPIALPAPRRDAEALAREAERAIFASRSA